MQPNVLQQTLQVNSGAAAESVGGEGGGVKAYTEEDEEKHYGYKDEAIDVLRHSYMHVWGTQGQHIGWRTHKQWLQHCADADVPGAPETMCKMFIIIESPKTPSHYRYKIQVLGYIPYTGLAVFSFAITRVPVYTAISFFQVRVLNASK